MSKFKVYDRVRLLEDLGCFKRAGDVVEVLRDHGDGTYDISDNIHATVVAGLFPSRCSGSRLEPLEVKKPMEELHDSSVVPLTWEYGGLGVWSADSINCVDSKWLIAIDRDGAFDPYQSDSSLVLLFPWSELSFKTLDEAKQFAYDIEVEQYHKRHMWDGAKEILSNWDNADSVDWDAREVLGYVRHLEERVKQLEGNKK